MRPSRSVPGYGSSLSWHSSKYYHKLHCLYHWSRKKGQAPVYGFPTLPLCHALQVIQELLLLDLGTAHNMTVHPTSILSLCRLSGSEGDQLRPLSAPVISSASTPSGSAGNTPRSADRHLRRSEGEAMPGSVRRDEQVSDSGG